MAKGKDLTLKDVEKVEELLQAGMGIDAIARILEIAPISVNRIKNGEHILQIRKNKEVGGGAAQRIARHICGLEWN